MKGTFQKKYKGPNYTTTIDTKGSHAVKSQCTSNTFFSNYWYETTATEIRENLQLLISQLGQGHSHHRNDTLGTMCNTWKILQFKNSELTHSDRNSCTDIPNN